MSRREADIPLEIPLALPARAYALARVAYYRDTKAPRAYEAANTERRTELLPAYLPTGGTIARRITSVDRHYYSGVIESGGFYVYGEPAEDVVLRTSDLVETTTPPSTTLVIPPTREELERYIRNGGPRPTGRTVSVPDPARAAVIVATPAFSRLPPVTRVYGKDERRPRFEFYPSPVDEQRHMKLLAVEGPREKHGRYLVRRDGAPLASGLDWWQAGPAGDVLVVFAPTHLTGQWSQEVDADLRELDAPDLALVLDPHPWIPAELLPAGEGYAVVAVSYNFSKTTLTRFRRVRTRYLVVPAEEKHGIRRRAEGWIGRHVDEKAEKGLDAVFALLPGDAEKALRSVVRSAAFEAVLTVAAGAVSFGAGAGLAQAAIAGAGRAGVDVGGAVQAALPGAQLAGSPVGQGAVAGAASSPVATAGSPVNQALAIAGKAAPDARAAAPHAAAKQVNRALEEAARGSAYLAGFDNPYGVFLREAIVQAQLSPRDRDELRLKLAKITAQVNEKGGDTLVVAKIVWQVVRSVVLAGAGSGLDQAAEAALAVAQRSVQVLTQALQAANEGELLRIVEERVRAKQLELVRELEALLTAQQPAPAPVAEVRGDASRPAAGDASPVAPSSSATPVNPFAAFASFLGRIGEAVTNFFRSESWRSTSTST